MKIFKEIYKEVERSAGEDIYLGHFPFSEFDDQDKEELHKWTPLGSTLYTREIGKQTFSFDIIISES